MLALEKKIVTEANTGMADLVKMQELIGFVE